MILLAGVSVMVGMWRALSELLMRPRSPDDRSVIPLGPSEGWLTAVVVIAAIGTSIWVGLAPQSIAPLADRLADVYTFFLN
jgi:hypothetical protein